MSQIRTEFEQLNDQKSAGLVRELSDFIVANKAWWMVPIAFVLGVLGCAVVLMGTGVAPFIYVLW